jgi:HK97 family phage prohead protease
MENKINISVENFTAENTKEGVKVVGLALPFEKTSRNGFVYNTESIKEKSGTLKGRPVLFNHDSDKVIGHVKDVKLSGKGMEYVMDLDNDPTTPYGWVARKVERGDLTNVSIQASYDPEKSFISEEGVTHAYITEFYELSVVTIPGFADTTAQVMEKLKEIKGGKMVKTKEEEKPEDPDKKEENDVKDPEKKESDTEKPDYEERLGKLEKALASISKKLETMSKSKKDDDNEESDEEDDDKEKEKKGKELKKSNDDEVEEAIRNDKKTIVSETTKQEIKNLTTEDLKKLLIEVN